MRLVFRVLCYNVFIIHFKLQDMRLGAKPLDRRTWTHSERGHIFNEGLCCAFHYIELPALSD
jgi:hypothetical protein